MRGGAAEDQEPGGSGGSVCHDSKNREELWHPLDLINDHEAPKILDRECGVGQTGQISWVLEIKLRDPFPAAGSQLAGEGGFPYLARTDDADDRKPIEKVFDLAEHVISLNHDHILP